MPAALIPIIIEALVKYAPAMVVEIIALLRKETATDEDWKALADSYRGKTYESYIPKG